LRACGTGDADASGSGYTGGACGPVGAAGSGDAGGACGTDGAGGSGRAGGAVAGGGDGFPAVVGGDPGQNVAVVFVAVGLDVVEVHQAAAGVPADHQDAVVGLADDGGDGEFEVGGGGFGGGKAAGDGGVAPEDVAFVVGVGVDAADLAERSDKAVAVSGDDLGCNAEEDVAGICAIGHHGGDLKAAAVAQRSSEHDGGAFGDGDRVAVVAAEGELIGTEVQMQIVGNAENQSIGVLFPGDLALRWVKVGVKLKGEGRDRGEADWVVGGEAGGGFGGGLDGDPHLVLRAAGAGNGNSADLRAGVCLNEVRTNRFEVDGVAPVNEEDGPSAEGAGVGVLGDWGEVGVADDDDLKAGHCGVGGQVFAGRADGDGWRGAAVGQGVGAERGGEKCGQLVTQFEQVHALRTSRLYLGFRRVGYADTRRTSVSSQAKVGREGSVTV
jgi:hypothetical protein